jgi:predicted ABC-type ATPase
MRLEFLDKRPLLVALAGPNGSGKTTFYETYLAHAGLRYLSADVLMRELDVEAPRAAELANTIRRALFEMRESFVFETVFSDPVGDKRRFLREADQAGYTVLLCYIGISSVEMSEARVEMRVLQGGHNVPTEKLAARFPRTLDNLRVAILELPHVIVYDNDDLESPFRHVATFRDGIALELHPPIPSWLSDVTRTEAGPPPG